MMLPEIANNDLSLGIETDVRPGHVNRVVPVVAVEEENSLGLVGEVTGPDAGGVVVSRESEPDV